ncbi:MAG: C10 family peptidase [Treponema sp.]|nr:C10 family peptidase [Treponema sp.]
MKKKIFLYAVLLLCLFFTGCSLFDAPDVKKNAAANSPDAEELDRKDVLALMYLQNPHVSEEALASYVMDFLNADDGSETERSIQAAPTHTITKTTKLMHPVETGFAETTVDRRSARPVISPGEIPFYVFTLENKETGQTGFALTCGDSRIGEVLAVVDAGNYDDDIPPLAVFYSQLNAYIEETIEIYNSISQSDIENSVKNYKKARNINLPVTTVGNIENFVLAPGYYSSVLLKTKWHQRYNAYLNENKKPPQGYEYITGCTATAIAQIMAYHKKPGKMSIFKTNYAYNWDNMINGSDDYFVSVLMFEIGWLIEAEYKKGKIETDEPSTTAKTTIKSKIAFRNMGYKDPGNAKKYNYSIIQSSIDKKKPVLIQGYTDGKKILGIPIVTGEGHAWVIDGYRGMLSKFKNKFTGEVEVEPIVVFNLPLKVYVHCNMGWEYEAGNGWYASAVFNTNKIPLDDQDDTYFPRSTKEGNYSFNPRIIADITPK